jgi:HK97 family phage major capsid protein
VSFNGTYACPGKSYYDDQAEAIIARFGNAADLAHWRKRTVSADVVREKPPEKSVTAICGDDWLARSEGLSAIYRSTRSHGREAYEIELPQAQAAIGAGRRRLPLLEGNDPTKQVGVVEAREDGKALVRFSRTAGAQAAQIALATGKCRLSLAYVKQGKALPTPAAVVLQTSQSDVLSEENTMSDANEILALGARHNRSDLAAAAVAAGKSIAQFRGELIEALGETKLIDSWPHEYRSEPREFSLTRLIHAEVTGDYSNAGYEREMAQEARRNYAGKAKGLVVPSDALLSRASMLTSGTAAGAVGTTLLGSAYIDALRPASAVMAAGATMFPGLGANVSIPKNTGDLSAAWVAEGGTIAESDIDVTTVDMVPRMVAGRASFTRHLLATSTPAIDDLVKRSLLAQITNAIDKAALEGSGTAPTPRGVLNTSGVAAFTTTGTGVMTWSEAHTAMAEVAAANLDNSRGTWILHPDDAAMLATLSVDSGSGRFVLENGMVAGRRVIQSTHATAGKLYFGLFEHVYIGMWAGLDLIIDPYTNGSTGTVNIYAHQLADVAVAYPQAFCVATLKTA